MMNSVASQISQNYQSVRSRIAIAAKRSGRTGEDVRLVAVTKYAQIDWIDALIELGQTEFGENRPQQLIERAGLFPRHVNWHLIGHLQSNKAKRVLPVAGWIHSVDSWRLLRALDQFAGELSLRPRVLLEVNVTGEGSKDGFSPEIVETDWQVILACRNLEIQGLMTMAMAHVDPETARPAFRTLRELRDKLIQTSEGQLTLPQLSMGMTGDLEVAIEEGATMVRIGSALFQGLSTTNGQ